MQYQTIYIGMYLHTVFSNYPGIANYVAIHTAGYSYRISHISFATLLNLFNQLNFI